MKDFKAFETTKREYVANTVTLNKENQELKQRLQKLANENTDLSKMFQNCVSKGNEVTSNIRQKQQKKSATKNMLQNVQQSILFLF